MFSDDYFHVCICELVTGHTETGDKSSFVNPAHPPVGWILELYIIANLSKSLFCFIGKLPQRNRGGPEF